MKSHRMVPALALLLILVLASAGGLAATAPERTLPSNAAVTGPFQDTARWLEMNAAAKPCQAEMRNHQKELKTLQEELSLEVEAARVRIKDLLSAAITAEQLALVNDHLGELKDIVDTVKADIGRLGNEMTVLRGRQTDLDLEGMIACFAEAIAIQEDRLTLVSDAAALVKAIASDT